MKLKPILIGTICFLVYLALVILLGYALHFSASKLLVFCLLLGLLGLLGLVAILWYLHKIEAANSPDDSASTPDNINLRALLRDADARIRQAGRSGVKSLAAMPMLYVIGDENSAKTQTVLRSGLDPELLAGAVYQDQNVAPTQLINLWLSGEWIIAEAGGILQRKKDLWAHFIKATLPARFGSAFSKDARMPARLVLVCVSIERIMAPNTTEQIRALAQSLNERIRQLSQSLGIALPVYVVFTKLDAIAPFADFATQLTEEEVKLPIGALVPASKANSGLYSEEAAAVIGTQFDRLIYSLSEFRVEALSRGGQMQNLARAYEFPRDLRKLRAGIVSFLVDLARPSQIGVNPFLRGFFCSGMRAHFVQSILDVGPMQAQPQAVPDSGATRAFSFNSVQNLPTPQPVRGSATRKEPQWVFLPQLMSRIVLADKSALEASRASTRTHVLRRALLVCASAAALVVLALATISFFNNRSLVGMVVTAAHAPVLPPSGGAVATQSDLENLDRMRAALDELEQYNRHGAPTFYRMGLYRGNALLPYACQAYNEKFRTLLLGPTQAAIVARLGALPAAPAKEDSYVATYRPLKAYLITVSNPNPDTPQDTTDFLPAALAAAWAGNSTPDGNIAQLALRQFTFYSAHLAAPGSCMAAIGGTNNHDVVNHARVYLSGFEGFQHIYQSMLTAAGRTSPAFSFNSKFPGSSQFIYDDYTIQGAFTKEGFAFMQDAILHPDAYVGGEQWVLGPSSAGPIDRAALAAQLKSVYTADFIQTWRAYLNRAQFTGYQNLQDAATKLATFDSASSPVLELLSLAAANTKVASPEISMAFQAPQAVVPQAGVPNAMFIAPVNQPYIQALQSIEAAIKGVLANPMAANDPAAFGPIGQAAVAADQMAKSISIGFVPDRVGNVDKTTLAILEAPIEAAESLAAQAPARAAGGAAKNFCTQIAPLMAKFPFTPSSTIEATPEEVAQVFAPNQGAFWQFYNASIRALAVQQGAQFAPPPGSAVKINPAFLAFLANSQRISSALFPAGGNQPALDFSLTEVRAPGTSEAALTVDGKEIKGYNQTGSFHWVAQPSSSIVLASPQDTRTFSKTWSAFHFAFAATQPSPNRLKFSFSLNNQAPEVVLFDAAGSGAPMLNPEFMKNYRCVATVGR